MLWPLCNTGEAADSVCQKVVPRRAVYTWILFVVIALCMRRNLPYMAF